MSSFKTAYSQSPESPEALLEILHQQALQLAPWLKSIAFLLMFIGATLTLTIVAMPVSMLPVAMGIVLYQAGNRASQVGSGQHSLPLVSLLNRLRLYFILAFFSSALGLVFVMVGAYYLTTLSDPESASLLYSAMALVKSLWQW